MHGFLLPYLEELCFYFPFEHLLNSNACTVIPCLSMILASTSELHAAWGRLLHFRNVNGKNGDFVRVISASQC